MSIPDTRFARFAQRADVLKKMKTELIEYEEATNKQFDAQTQQIQRQNKIERYDADQILVENETRGPIAQVAYDGESYEKYLNETYGPCK